MREVDILEKIRILLKLEKVEQKFEPPGGWEVYFDDKLVYTSGEYLKANKFLKNTYLNLIRKEKIKRLLE